MNSLTYRAATEEELEAVWSVISDGRAALRALGIDQWQGPGPRFESVQEDIALGRCRVAVSGDGAVLGTLAFVEGPEHDYEHSLTAGGWIAPEGSGYVALHRVAVSAAAKRRGVCTFMYNEAVDEARNAGFASARVDTHAGNIPMQRVLEKAGFQCCCEMMLSDAEEPTLHRIGYERLV